MLCGHVCSGHNFDVFYYAFCTMMYLEFNRVRVDHAAVFCSWLTSSNSAISKTSPFKSIGSFPETVSEHEVESEIRVIGIDTELLLNTVNPVFYVITVHV